MQIVMRPASVVLPKVERAEQILNALLAMNADIEIYWQDRKPVHEWVERVAAVHANHIELDTTKHVERIEFPKKSVSEVWKKAEVNGGTLEDFILDEVKEVVAEEEPQQPVQKREQS